MNQKLYALDKSGNPLVGPVLIPFFTTVFPAFFRKANWIEIHSNLATGEVRAKYAAKPDIIIDDMPMTAVAPFIFNVQDEASWPSMAEKIIAKHLD